MSLVGFTLTGTVAHASGFVVTVMTDGGTGSLRNAIDQANAQAGQDTITLPAGVFKIALLGANEDSNASGDFDILGDTTIIGAGAGKTIIDANGVDRAFELFSGATVLQGLTVTNGNVGADYGGNIMDRGNADLTVQDSVVSHGSALVGAGIYSSHGELKIIRSEIIDNVAPSVPGDGSVGSAIYKGGDALGNLTMVDSLIAGNTAIDGGAALQIDANATITNTTITGNSSYAGTVEVSVTGGDSIAVSLVHVTIAGNTATGDLAGDAVSVIAIPESTAVVTVEGSLFQNNFVQGLAAASNCDAKQKGSFVSAGHNLTDDSTCATFTKPGDQINNASTTLGALADNGGPTRTMALVAGSSAIDAAGACGAVTPTDQRGLARPTGSACDVGAFEVGEVVPPTTESPTTVVPITVATGSTLVEPPTSVSVPPPVTLPPFDGGQLPSTGSSHGDTLWLALLACSLGGLLVIGARRVAR